MIRKISAFLLCFWLISCTALSVSAYSSRVIDQAGLLESGEVEVLNGELRELSATYGLDIVYLTVDSLNGKSAMTYADDYYDSNGFGEDGILFLLAMREREWYISTSGSAIRGLSDRELEQIEYEIVPYFSAGRYYDGFYRFLDILPDYLSANRPERSVNLLISVVTGAVTAAVAVLVMRASMNTRRRQHSAADYLDQGSYHLRYQRDLFLYSRVSRVRRQENNGGGGSSVHRSSSGRSHGGRGGRF